MCLILDLYFREEEIPEGQDHWEETAVNPGRKREGKNIFWELLRVLRKRQEEAQDMGVQDEVGIFCFLFDINVFLILMFTLSSTASSLVIPSPPRMIMRMRSPSTQKSYKIYFL